MLQIIPAPSETVAKGFEVPTAKLKPEPEATVTGVGLNPKPVKGVELGPPIVFVADNWPMPKVRPDLGGDGFNSDSLGFAVI